MPSEEANKVKLRVMDWLREEGFLAEEKEGHPQAIFNISASKGGLAFNVLQASQHSESFVVCSTVCIPPEQKHRLQEIPLKRRQDFVWALNMEYIKNNELGDFAIEPEPPGDMQSFFVSTRQIYYDKLSKGKFMFSVHVLLRAAVMTMWMLQKLLGVSAPSVSDKKQDYYLS
jgi:hypothetical protein